MSQLSLKTIKLGDSADESKNFLIKTPAVADGTLVIERGNGTDVLSIDASGNVAFPSMPGFGLAPIIESGSNAEGNYIKFADGTLYQWGLEPEAIAISTAYSGAFRSTTSIVDFPLSFNDTNYTLNLTTTLDSAAIGAIEVTSARLVASAGVSWIANVSSATATRYVYWSATGRWK